MNPYIYKLTLLKSVGTPGSTKFCPEGSIYIGKHNGREKWYFSGGVLPNNIAKKHGYGIFKKEKLVSGEFNDAFLKELERHYIRIYNSVRTPKNIRGLNFTAGHINGDYSKPIYKYDLDGNYIGEFTKQQLSTEGIKMTLCRMVANDKAVHSKQHAGFQWKNYKSSKIDAISYNKGFKNIYQFDLNGVFIKKWKDIKEIKQSNFSPYGAYNCIVDKLQQSNGFIWSLSETPKEYTGFRTNQKDIHRYSLCGKYIDSFRGLKAAAKFIGIRYISDISKCAKGTTRSGNGFIWSYEKTDCVAPHSPPRIKTKKRVTKFDMLGNKIMTYDSLHHAKRETNIERSSIKHACEGKASHAGGFKWEYAIK